MRFIPLFILLWSSVSGQQDSAPKFHQLDSADLPGFHWVGKPVCTYVKFEPGTYRTLADKCDTCKKWTVYDASRIIEIDDSMQDELYKEIMIKTDVRDAALALYKDLPSPGVKVKDWPKLLQLQNALIAALKKEKAFYEHKNQHHVR